MGGEKEEGWLTREVGEQRGTETGEETSVEMEDTCG